VSSRDVSSPNGRLLDVWKLSCVVSRQTETCCLDTETCHLDMETCRRDTETCGLDTEICRLYTETCGLDTETYDNGEVGKQKTWNKEIAPTKTTVCCLETETYHGKNRTIVCRLGDLSSRDGDLSS